MRKWMLLGVLALLWMPAHASPGKVKKAAKLQAAYEAGDRDALVEALSTLDLALEHPKVADDPAAWALSGHLRLEQARVAGDTKAMNGAADDLEKALSLGAEGEVRDRVISDLKGMLSTLFQRTVDDFESKRLPEAAGHLEAVLEVRATLDGVGTSVDAVEERLLALAAQIHLARNEIEQALAYHDQLEERDAFNAGLTAALARAMAEEKRTDDALALLGRMAAAHPDNTRLLRAEVELRVGMGDTDGAVARIDGAKETLWTSVSGSYLLYELYLSAGDEAKSLESARHLIELDPRHVDALMGAARVLGIQADAKQAEIESGKLRYSEKKARTTEIAALRTEVIRLLEQARTADATHVGVLRALATAHRAQGDEEAARAVEAEADTLERPE